MEKEQLKYEINQVEQTIALDTQQLKLAVKYIINDSKHINDKISSNLNIKLEKVSNKLKKLDISEQAFYLKKVAKQLSCEIALINKFTLKPIFNQTLWENDAYLQFKKSKYKENSWLKFVKQNEENVCPSKTTHMVYNKSFDKKSTLFLSCNTKQFYNPKNNEEMKIKKYIQKSFSYTKHLHKGNTYLMWLNVQNANNKPLYNENDKYKNSKYCISKLSEVKIINTGTLSAKQILNAADKEYISHILEGKKALTWVRNINADSKRRLIFITTIFEEDLHNNLDKTFWKLFPASIIALLLAVLMGYLLFRKFSKNFDILLNASKQVQKGNLKFRSNIKGKDSISQLGYTFDLMLDSMENNIKNLDLKVEERTRELKKSLDEKNTLLKEIHHRVKNNLAFTISLIKIQKRKVEDEKTKNVLTDIQERIHIMELLHRKLYESKDLNLIPFKKYVKELVYDMSYAYKAKQLQLNLDIEDLFMNIELALPCGLIINECLTNSLKYAFEKKTKKVFSLKFKKDKDKYFLEISDNGVGLSENLDIYKTKSSGIRLIVSIVQKQLLGEIEYKFDKGCKYFISF